MSYLCGLLDCEKPVESVFYRISIYKNKYSNYVSCKIKLHKEVNTLDM